MAGDSDEHNVRVTGVTIPPVEKFDVGEVTTPPVPPFNAKKEKAIGAREVARVLVFTFAGTVAATFLTIALIYGLSASPSQARTLSKPSLTWYR